MKIFVLGDTHADFGTVNTFIKKRSRTSSCRRGLWLVAALPRHRADQQEPDV
jgi:hypothetical protein